MGDTFDMLNLPARRAGDWLLPKLGYILGERRLGPDMIVAPPGVPAILHTLGWLAFIVYWFVIGTAAYSVYQLLKRWRSRQVRG
jgi:hypothetical protein